MTRADKAEIERQEARRRACPRAVALQGSLAVAAWEHLIPAHEAAAVAWVADLARQIDRGHDISEIDAREGRLLLARWMRAEGRA